MFSNATVSSRGSSSRSTPSCGRNSSMPSLRMRNPLSPKTSYNPLFRHSDAFTSFDASHFVFEEHPQHQPVLKRYNSHDSSNYRLQEHRLTDSSDTPDSTKSRTDSDSTDDRKKKPSKEYEARDFLERYSLPRVVRVEDGEPLLLYRCFDSFTKVLARCATKKGKERNETVLHFPEGYSGWFSLTNEKGEKSAVCHTSVLQLVREQVCSFVSMQSFTAYAAQPSDISDGKVQYLKTQVRAGQLFQLRAVFQHKERPEGMGRNSTRSSRISRSVKDKDLSNRYAQLVSQTNQELYVQLTTKGEFYEIHSSMKARLCFPGMLDKTGPLALDKDCLYKLSHLLRRVALPVRVKLMLGNLPNNLPKDFSDTFLLERKFQEPLMVTCTLPPPGDTHKISCININSNVRISKCTLGFDSENRLFKSQRLQAALAFCHKNVEAWYREVRFEVNCNQAKRCEECKKVYQDKHSCFKEGKEQEVKARRKWFKFRILGEDKGEKFGDLKDPMDGMEKGKSIDRYKDMSKLIEEKFGKKSYNPVKKSASFMFSNKRMDLEENASNPALLKCQSLDNQLYTEQQRRNSKSNISDSLSYDFQMCILENDNEPEPEPKLKLKKNKPDLIPTLPKPDEETSFITERLCSEFHVKTKQKKTFGKSERNYNIKKSVVQVHELRSLEEVPYSKVVDEVKEERRFKKGLDEENIYAEICENKKDSEYCYVKLGSNGESVQSDSDEAIYNTLR